MFHCNPFQNWYKSVGRELLGKCVKMGGGTGGTTGRCPEI